MAGSGQFMSGRRGVGEACGHDEGRGGRLEGRRRKEHLGAVPSWGGAPGISRAVAWAEETKGSKAVASIQPGSSAGWLRESSRSGMRLRAGGWEWSGAENKRGGRRLRLVGWIGRGSRGRRDWRSGGGRIGLMGQLPRN